MRLKGVPKITTLKATKHSPQRYRIRWDDGRRSFTDTDNKEVLRFALDLVATTIPAPAPGRVTRTHDAGRPALTIG